MPSWKKVIVSGSDAALNSLTVTNGATVSSSLTLSGSINNVNYIDFNTSYTATQPVAGRLSWNNSDGTLDLGMKGGNVTQQIGEEIFYEVRNDTGTPIANGTSVYANGVTAGSSRITAAPFVADGSVREVRYLGLATEDISNGVNGFVTHFGYVRNLDTRGNVASSIAVGDETWAVGDTLYAHPTVAGKLTNVKPKHEISVAIIIVRHQSTGVVFTRPISYGHLDDIHDVNINTGSLSTGDLLIYDSGSDYWINSKQLSGSYGLTGSLNVTQGITGSLQGTASYASQALSSSFAVSSSRAVSSSFATLAASATNATNSTNISVSDSGDDTTTWVLIANSQTGIQEARTDAQLIYNAASRTLTTQTFVGDLTGTATTASNITPALLNDADTRLVTANGNGTLSGEGNLQFDGNTLKVLYQAGDEGGEILMAKPVTNTTIAGTGVTVDIYQNKLRFFEQGGSARGYYLDITAGGAGVGTNLASGGGTVTSVGGTGTVNGLTLSGNVSGSGNLTLGGILSGIGNAQLTNSSITVGSTNIALGATSTTLAGLSSVTATNFTGTASFATNSDQLDGLHATSFVLNSQTSSMTVTSASFAANASSSLRAISSSFATLAATATNATTATTANSTVAAATFNNAGSGDASGTTFNGGTARTISYNTVGAPSTSGTNATGTWGISITGNALTATSASFATNASSSLFAVSSSRAVSSSFATVAQSVLGTITNANTASNITPAITNTANNRVLTDNGGGTINAESALTFDGTTLILVGKLENGNASCVATGLDSHAEGSDSKAIGNQSHAEGINTITTGGGSHAEGYFTSASGLYSHAEGNLTISVGDWSHAEGNVTISVGDWSHAEGLQTSASGDCSHAEGAATNAIGDYSHAEGDSAYAIGLVSHAEGIATNAVGDGAHAEGESTYAGGYASHAAGNSTSASGDYQSVIGSWNKPSTNPTAFIIGNGTGPGTESNLLYASGSNVQITGSLYVSRSDNDQLSAIFATRGSKTNPAYTFIGDEDTGMYRDSANTVGLTAGSQIRVLASDTQLYLNPGTTTFQSNILTISDDPIPLVSKTPRGDVSVGTATSASFATNASSSLFAVSSSRAVSSSFATVAQSVLGTITNANTASNITPAITTGNTNNNVLTANGNGTLTGESNLTFDGTNLQLRTGSLTFISQSVNSINVSLAPGGGSANGDEYLDVFAGGSRIVRMGDNPFDVTEYGTGLSVTGRVRLRASALGSAATQILVFDGDPSSTTRGIYTRTPSELRGDMGAGTVSSIATNNGVTGGTITSTGTIGLTGQALALHNLATNGLIARTGAGTVAGRTLTGTANQITVTNGDGVSGNPTISLPSTITGLSSVTSTGFTGDLSGTATTATNANFINVVHQNNSNAYKILFNTDSTGSKQLMIDPDSSQLTYNPSTQVLTAGTFSGALTGNASTATTATSASNVTVTTSAGASAFKIPFINHTGTTAGTYALLQDSVGGATYTPSTNLLSSENITATNYAFGYSIYTQNGIGIYDDGDLAIGDYEANTTNAATSFYSNGNLVMSVNNQNLYVSHSLGISTGSPQTKLHVEDVTKVLTNNVAGVAQGTLSLVSTDAQAADKGASLVFGGNYINSNSSKIAFAAITGRKSNSTNSNADGYLSFLTWRTTGLTEAMRITAAGSMGLGITAPAATAGRFEASNDIVAYSTSDKRWKNNIVKIDSPLEKISQISGVEFDWIEDEPLHGNKGHDVGVIAQEIELVIPEAVQTRESGMKAVQYDKIIPLLIESIKEQQKQIDELKELVNKLTK